MGPLVSHCNDYKPASPQLTKKEKKGEGARSRAPESSFASGKKAGDGPNASAPKPTIKRLFETMRSEIGEHAYRTWLAPLQVVDHPNGSLTFQAPSKCHRDYVSGHYGSRMETITGVLVEVVSANAPPAAPPTARPPKPAPRVDRPDLSQVLQPMPPGDDNGTGQPPGNCREVPPRPAPLTQTRRRVSGFTRQEIEAGALDEVRPPDKPPPAQPPTPT